MTNYFKNAWTYQKLVPIQRFCKGGAYTMKFFFHDLEIIISKEKCRNISGREMCVMKYYSELRYAEKVHSKRDFVASILL